MLLPRRTEAVSGERRAGDGSPLIVIRSIAAKVTAAKSGDSRPLLADCRMPDCSGRPEKAVPCGENFHAEAVRRHAEVRIGGMNGPILQVEMTRIRPLMLDFSIIRHALPEQHRVSGFLKKMVSVGVGIVLTGADGRSYHYPTIVPKLR